MRTLAALVLIGFSIAVPAKADDISDAIAEAKSAYDGGDLAGTKQALDLASQMLSQKQSDALAKLLPKPPSGWTADKVSSEAGMAGMLGGGISVSRTYRKDDKTAQVNLMANSPILGTMAPMFSNIQVLGALGKVFRQKGRVGVLSSENEIQMVIGKTWLTIDGSADEASKRAILDTIDLATLEAFAK